MERLRTTVIYRDARLTLFAVESIVLEQSNLTTSLHLTGSLKPVAIIVNSRHGSYALDMEANPLALDTLSELLPELNDLLC